MSGNNNTFHILKSQCKDDLLLDKKDKYALKPVDYSEMFNHTTLKERYFQHYDKSIIKPGHIYSFWCSEHTINILNQFITLEIALHCSGMDEGQKILAGAALVAIQSVLAQISEYDYCSQVKRYNAIDISDPSEFTSPKQFEKYMLENSDVYVNNTCGNNKQISLISLPISDDIYITGELSFVLCQTI